jgi:UDP-N-acetylglucosamine 3-dehydrogenase
MLKGGVFGFGGVGQAMTREINLRKVHGDGLHIVAAANRGQEKRDKAKKDYGLAVYDNVDDLIAHGLDFMLIVSTSHAHHEAAVKCARAKIPYLIEKPIALRLDEARDIVATAEEAGIINGVNYSMRYVPAYQKMKQIAESGQLGELLAIWAATHRGYGLYGAGERHPAIANPKESGGWIVHHMCHIVDWVIWLAGEVDEVYALTRSTAPAELDSEELIFGTIKFKNGVIGTLADQVGAYRDHAAGVIGTKGGVGEINDGIKQLLKLHLEADKRRPGMEWSIPHIVDPEEGLVPESGLGHFLRCLKEGRETNVPVREALYSLEVCHAMTHSAHEGRPVRMD